MISSIPKWAGNLFEGLLAPNVKVVKISFISRNVRKIRFQGDISRMNFQIGYASVIRVSETEYRNYTVSYHDERNGILDIVFHMHGNGVGSQFIDALQMGDEVFISSPRGRKDYHPEVKEHLIFGDETSLGLACSFFPVLRKNQHLFQFYFELKDENRHVPQALGLENFTVFPKDGSFGNEEWINQLPVFQQPDWHNAHFVLTGNVKSIRAFRKVLKRRSMEKISYKGYWLEGKKGL